MKIALKKYTGSYNPWTSIENGYIYTKRNILYNALANVLIIAAMCYVPLELH